MKHRCSRCMKEYDVEYEICPHCGYVIGTEPKEPYHLVPGTVLKERYELGVVLGYGGFGTTYIAWDNKLEVAVAIKEYYQSGIVNRMPGTNGVIVYSGKSREAFEKGLHRFLEEARNTAKFSNHPNIVNVFDYFEANGTAYIVMEFLSGVSLKEFIYQNGGKIDLPTTVTILEAIIEALKAIHKEGILHRDISPDNIFITEDNRIKLIDFGAARFQKGEKDSVQEIVLKPGFAPPEQYRSKGKQDARTDIYALGATMYRAITGIMPEESVNRVVDDTLRTPRQIDESIPEHVSRTLMKAMALEPDMRFQSVSDFQNALLKKKKVYSLEQDLKRRKRKRMIQIVASFLFICLLAAGTVFFYQYRMDQIQNLEGEMDIWIMVEDGANKEEEESKFMSLCAEFMEHNPLMDLNITAIAESEYEDAITKAAESETLPAIFETTNLNESLIKYVKDAEDVFDKLDKEDFYLIESYLAEKKSVTGVPLGVDVPVVYINSSLGYEQLTKQNDMDAFLSGKSLAIVAGTNDYANIQKDMSGLYAVTSFEGETQISLCDVMSISCSTTKEEERAAVQLLYYLLGEQAQDTMCIHEHMGMSYNKSVVDVYVDINQELAFVREGLQNNTIYYKDGEEQNYSILYDERIINDNTMQDKLKSD